MNRRALPSAPRLLWFIVATFALVIPVYVSPHADDVFRLPKELLLSAEAIIVLAFVAITLIWHPDGFRTLRLDRVTATAVAAVASAALLATMLSVNRAISIGSLAYVLASIVVFWAVYVASARVPLTRAVLVGAGAGVVNALLAIAQRLDWWNPFYFDESIPHRERTTAFIGNPNDVGASIAVCLIAVAALAVVKRKVTLAIVAAILTMGVLASDALTAIIAIVGAVLAMAVLVSPRLAWLSIVGVVAVSMITVFTLPPLRARMYAMAAEARAHDYDALTSHRIVGYLTAYKIFRDYPLTGAGPGTFKWLHLPYRLRVETEYPRLYLKMTENLGAVHSDHLQILAEEGLVGYVALVVTVVALGSRSCVLQRKKNGEMKERARFVFLAALPLAICFLALAATGFPLELTAVTTPLLFFGACMLRWSHDVAA